MSDILTRLYEDVFAGKVGSPHAASNWLLVLEDDELEQLTASAKYMMDGSGSNEDCGLAAGVVLMFEEIDPDKNQDRPTEMLVDDLIKSNAILLALCGLERLSREGHLKYTAESFSSSGEVTIELLTEDHVVVSRAKALGMNLVTDLLKALISGRHGKRLQ